MPRFKVGDMVRIKHLPVADHGGLFYNEEMQTCAGSVDVILHVHSSGRYNLKYRSWTWNDEMLEPAPEEYRNKKLNYKTGDPVMFRGEKTVVVDTRCGHGYFIRDYPGWVRFEELEPVAGFDYNNYEVPAYNVGDIVVCKIKHDESYYGALSVNSTMLDYADKVGVITEVKYNCDPEEEGARYYCSFDNGIWTWNSLLVERIDSLKPFEPNERAIQLSDPPHLCVFDGEKFEGSDDEDLQTFVHVKEKNVKLRTDVFGIGEEGETIKSYTAEFTNQVLAAETTSKAIANTLYEGEYMEV